MRIVQLNNAATTPPFERKVREVQEFLGWYGALHRGAGPRARATVEAVERAVRRIRSFIGQPEDNALLFTANTSAAINALARLLPLDADDMVLTSEIEPTANNLPWRYNTPARVLDVRANDTGALDLDHLDHLFAEHRGRVALLAVTGALLFVDAAQLAPHRRIDMASAGVDALAFSAHKVYAPFGLGVLSLPRTVLDRRPVDPGGGSIDMIADTGSVVWAPPAERHQTGTWNATGILGLGASCATILDAGWDLLEGVERDLVARTASALSDIPGVRLTVPAASYRADDRIGTFPFVVDGLHHALVAAAPRTVASGPSTTRTTSATLMSLAGMPSRYPPSTPPALAGRRPGQRALVVVTAACYLAGYLALLALTLCGSAGGSRVDVLGWLAAALLGAGNGAFPLSVTLVGLRTSRAETTAAVSGLAQSGGYLLAVSGPLLVGVLHQPSGGWRVPLAALLATLLPQLIAGLRSARPGTVEAPDPAGDPR